MDWSEILKFTLPSLTVFFTAYLVIRQFLESETRRQRHLSATKNQELITPLRLQAYERVVLFLERISPESMLLRIPLQNLTSQQLQKEMLASLRAEYEHNLSQQIYLSPKAWEMVKSARTNLTLLINSSAAKVNPATPAMELSRELLEGIMDAEGSPVAPAIDFLKREIQVNFF